MASEQGPRKGGGMSLYANLLDPSAESTPGTISRAPVVFKQSTETDAQPEESAAKVPKINPATLQFQPTIRRPQRPNQKAKARPTLPKVSAPPTAPQNTTTAVEPAKTSIADWAGTLEDDLENYVGEKRQRGGRKKRKKTREQQEVEINWTEIFDPVKSSNYLMFMRSEDRVHDTREWKDRLYAHLIQRSPSWATDDFSSEHDYDRSKDERFAPPSNFAPPPNLNEYPPPAPASVPDDATGEDAFARRARLSQLPANDTVMSGYSEIPPPPTELPPLHPEEPIPPPPSDDSGEDAYLRRMQNTKAYSTDRNAPVQRSTRPLDTFQPTAATISRAPVRYTLPPPPKDIPATEAELEAVFAKEQPAENETESGEDAPRSLRPGQKGFAERLLSKYGWTKGSGLGATGSGIVNPLQVKVEKQKKRPDAEGGGFVTPAGRGKIIGGKKKGGDDEGKFGAMSEVIILKGMLNGMDVESEIESGELMQEIGDECTKQYGIVERIYIARDVGPPVPVFVKFASPLSALRAVNALEGRTFSGNEISARFFDREKFENGVYVE